MGDWKSFDFTAVSDKPDITDLCKQLKKEAIAMLEEIRVATENGEFFEANITLVRGPEVGFIQTDYMTFEPRRCEAVERVCSTLIYENPSLAQRLKTYGNELYFDPRQKKIQ